MKTTHHCTLELITRVSNSQTHEVILRDGTFYASRTNLGSSTAIIKSGKEYEEGQKAFSRINKEFSALVNFINPLVDRYGVKNAVKLTHVLNERRIDYNDQPDPMDEDLGTNHLGI